MKGMSAGLKGGLNEVMAAARPAASGDRLGLFFGYGGLRAHWEDMMPALAGQAPDAGASWARGLALLHPFWMLQHLSNNAPSSSAALRHSASMPALAMP